MEWTSNGSESNLEGGLVRGGRSFSIRLSAITNHPLSMTQKDLPESTELLFFLRNYRSQSFPGESLMKLSTTGAIGI